MKIIAGIERCDQQVVRLLQPYSSKPWLINTMKVVSIFASGFFCFPLYGAAYFLTDHHFLVATVVAGECVQLPIIIALRHYVKRPRPVDSGKYFSQWNTYSFPSLHTSRAFMLCLCVYFV